jgi:uncharacterized protein YraI
MKRLISSAIAAVLLSATASAFAYDGFATDTVNLRAGPDIDYPVVTVVPPGAPLSIQGCTNGYEWCDVIFDDTRGWVAGSYVQYEYNDQPVLLSGYGSRIGVPIVSFVIGDYWGSYYRNRPFWVERDRWYSRPYVHHPAPVYRGAFHDWGHDRGHYNGGYREGGHDGGYNRNGYAGHGGAYNGGSHAPQQQYNAQQNNAYQQHNAGQNHGYQQQQNVQQNHGYQQNVQQNHGNPQQQNAQQTHAIHQQQQAQQAQQVQHASGGQQYHQQGGGHAQGGAPQPQAAPAARQAPQQQHGEGRGHNKDDKDHDRGHR